MNSIVKVATRFSSMKNALNPVRQALFVGQNAPLLQTGTSRQFARSLWYMCSSDNNEILKLRKPTHTCSCGCSSGHQQIHTKGSIITYYKQCMYSPSVSP